MLHQYNRTIAYPSSASGPPSVVILLNKRAVSVVLCLICAALTISAFTTIPLRNLPWEALGSDINRIPSNTNLRIDDAIQAVTANGAEEKDDEEDKDNAEEQESGNGSEETKHGHPSFIKADTTNPVSDEELQTGPVMVWRVVVSSNDGFEHVFLNWFKSFIDLGLDKELPLVFIADDANIYEKYRNSTKMIVKRGWEASEKFNKAELTGDYRYGSRAYKQLVSRRPSLVLEELDHGNVLYIDTDTVLRADPRPYFTGNFDFWAQRHKYLKTGADAGKPTFCTGFMALRSTENTKALITDWKQKIEARKAGLNQGAFNKSVYNCRVARDLRGKALPEELFPTGNRYKNYTQEVRDKVVMMHNNYCRGGSCKQTRMEEYGLWSPATREEAL